MAKDPMGYANFEIPGEVRNFAEQSVDQARKAFDGFVTATQKAASAMEGHASVAQTGARDLRQKAMTYAEQNVANSFDFARRLVQSKSVEEMMQLQRDFMQSQMQALSEQAQVLGDSVQKSTASTMKPKG